MTSYRPLLASIICIFILVIASTSLAGEEGETKEEAGDTPVVFGDRVAPSWDGRENYSDRYESEFMIIGGDYLGENWKNSYYVGGGYYFHINNLIALGGQYFFSEIVVDKDTPFYQNLQTDNVHTAVGLCMLNTPAAFKVGSKAFNMDFYFTLGAGAMRLNKVWEPTGVIGGGAKFYFPVPWLALRLDINSYLHYTTYGNKHDFSGDVALGGGISFLLPTKKHRD